MYLIVVRDADVQIDVEICGTWSRAQIFGIFLWGKIKVRTVISKANVSVQKHLVSFLQDDKKVEVDADIDIQKWLKNVAAHLLEENIVLWNNVSIKTLPGLSVASKDVQASHGAKIEKMDTAKLFYMNAKWLGIWAAQRLIVDGYVRMMLDVFTELTKKDEERIFVRCDPFASA